MPIMTFPWRSKSYGDDDSYGGRSSDDRAPRQMYDAVCADCGRAAQAPFQPTGSLLVYGNDSFRARRLCRLDPELEAKVHDVVGLYLQPPKRAIVLSLDEKTQIQPLDRTQPKPAAAVRARRGHERPAVRARGGRTDRTPGGTRAQ
jgi:CxxC-x17-CxxC domain-containing protein